MQYAAIVTKGQTEAGMVTQVPHLIPAPGFPANATPSQGTGAHMARAKNSSAKPSAKPAARKTTSKAARAASIAKPLGKAPGKATTKTLAKKPALAAAGKKPAASRPTRKAS